MAAVERDVRIAVDAVVLPGDLTPPSDPRGLVIFAHGSGSGRKSPRSREVAAILQRHGLATLLFDLLTLDEEAVDRQSVAAISRPARNSMSNRRCGG